MDRMRISANEPSSVILSQTKWFQKVENDGPKCINKAKPKGWCNKPTKLQFQAINFSYWYINAVLSINNPEFDNDLLGQLYPIELD